MKRLLGLGLGTALLALVVSGCGAEATSGGGATSAYDTAKSDVMSKVKTWPQGAGSALKLVNGQSSKSLTMVVASRDAPRWDEAIKKWVIPFRAVDDGSATATLIFQLQEMKEGRFEGSDSKGGCVIGIGVGPNWDSQAPGVAWSDNDGGYCEVTLTAAARPGHFEGSFKAKLVSNSKDSIYRIEQGYVYVAR
jgi:hypothetical protein